MRNILYVCLFSLICSSIVSAQEAYVSETWVPARVTNIHYVNNVIPVTNYYHVITPVYSTTIQYVKVPVIYAAPVYQPYVLLKPPLACCYGPRYYVYYPNKY